MAELLMIILNRWKREEGLAGVLLLHSKWSDVLAEGVGTQCHRSILHGKKEVSPSAASMGREQLVEYQSEKNLKWVKAFLVQCHFINFEDSQLSI